MNKRLQQFLGAENISQSQFADSINVARASVSHILSGRNKPGYDFLESMARRYPSLNLEWLITGKGKMYKGQEDCAGDARELPPEDVPGTAEPTLFDDTASETLLQEASNGMRRKITKILVFYDNGTYREVF